MTAKRDGSARDTLTLQVLLAGAAHGDHDAFERLYRLVSPRLFALCRRVLGRDALAEEVLQETFVQIWRDAGGFDPTRGEPLPWMSRIARNRAIDTLRRRADVARQAPDLGAEDLGDDNDSGDPMLWLVRNEGAAALHHCLEELSVEQRKSIMLAFFHGMTHRELSHALKTPIGTVKSWVRRGLLALKGCLER